MSELGAGRARGLEQDSAKRRSGADGDWWASPRTGSAPVGQNASASARAVRPTAALEASQQQQQQRDRGKSLEEQQLAATVGQGGPSKQQQQAFVATSSTHRLGSIEILNENKQRQLQLEQQQSFKQHLEQRQRQIHQQLAGAEHFGHSQSGARQAHMAQAKSVAVNPFDAADEELLATAPAKRAAWPPPTSVEAPELGERAADTVSGKSGFLASLIGDPNGAGSEQQEQQQQQQQQERQQEGACCAQADSSRYSKLAEAKERSYNYQRDQDKRPFYTKDLATLLSECRGSRKLVILIVAIALLLDNMLLTAVVPIIPAYLYRLRIEREHRELLASGNASSSGHLGRANGRPQRPFSELDLNRNGQLEPSELEAEIERRINQSLAGARGRFSGSFFHPQVLKSAAGRRGEDEEEEEEAEEADIEDEDDDDGGEEDEQRGKSFAADNYGRRRPVAAAAAAARRRTGRAARSPLGDQAADYEQLEAGELASGKPQSEPGGEIAPNSEPSARRVQAKLARRPASAAPRRRAEETGSGDPPQMGGPKADAAGVEAGQMSGSDEEEEGNNSEYQDQEQDDDEDSANSRRWSKLRSALVSTARRNGNDTDQLGGMCLRMVLEAGDSQDEQRRRPKQRPAPTGAAQQAEQAGAGGPLSRQPARPRPRARVQRPSGRAQKAQAAATTTTTTTTSTSQPPVRDPAELRDDELVINHQDIVDESFEVGVMFASKPVVQALANPFVGAITNRVGFTLPMFLGFTIMFLSTLVFAFGSTYATLFLARAIQGIGSACTSVAGMSMLADRFPDDAERGNAMAVALGGLALGVVIGPPFGGFMYEFFGKASPFIVLAGLALLDGLLQLLVLQPRISKCPEEGASLWALVRDPYILVAAGAITFANTGIGILEPALPLWMMDTMQARNWEQGVAFLPAALSYLFSTNLFGNLGLRIGRWRSAMLGLVVIGCSLLLIPFARRVDHLILPNGAIGFAIGMVDSTMMPMLGYLVDIRHTSVYGSVYAIGDVAFCASFVFGPALSGTLVELIGFEGLVVTTALICFAFAPLLFMLRNPPAREPQLEAGASGAPQASQADETAAMRYVNYTHLDSPDEEASQQQQRQPKQRRLKQTKSYVH